MGLGGERSGKTAFNAGNQTALESQYARRSKRLLSIVRLHQASSCCIKLWQLQEEYGDQYFREKMRSNFARLLVAPILLGRAPPATMPATMPATTLLYIQSMSAVPELHKIMNDWSLAIRKFFFTARKAAAVALLLPWSAEYPHFCL